MRKVGGAGWCTAAAGCWAVGAACIVVVLPYAPARGTVCTAMFQKPMSVTVLCARGLSQRALCVCTCVQPRQRLELLGRGPGGLPAAGVQVRHAGLAGTCRPVHRTADVSVPLHIPRAMDSSSRLTLWNRRRLLVHEHPLPYGRRTRAVRVSYVLQDGQGCHSHCTAWAVTPKLHPAHRRHSVHSQCLVTAYPCQARARLRCSGHGTVTVTVTVTVMGR